MSSDSTVPEATSRRRLSRRTWLGIGVPLVLVAGYFLITGAIRQRVDGLIQHSVGRPLPDFSLPDLAGRVWSPQDLRGKRAVLHFFRSRCHNCDAEAPAMRELEAALPADVVLLHVMTDVLLQVAAAETAATIANKQFTRPVVMADGKFVDAFHSVGWAHVTPITYVVDASGVIRFGLRGRQDRSAIEGALAAAR